MTRQDDGRWARSGRGQEVGERRILASVDGSNCAKWAEIGDGGDGATAGGDFHQQRSGGVRECGLGGGAAIDEVMGAADAREAADIAGGGGVGDDPAGGGVGVGDGARFDGVVAAQVGGQGGR